MRNKVSGIYPKPYRRIGLIIFLIGFGALNLFGCATGGKSVQLPKDPPKSDSTKAPKLSVTTKESEDNKLIQASAMITNLIDSKYFNIRMKDVHLRDAHCENGINNCIRDISSPENTFYLDIGTTLLDAFYSVSKRIFISCIKNEQSSEKYSSDLNLKLSIEKLVVRQEPNELMNRMKVSLREFNSHAREISPYWIEAYLAINLVVIDKNGNIIDSFTANSTIKKENIMFAKKEDYFELIAKCQASVLNQVVPMILNSDKFYNYVKSIENKSGMPSASIETTNSSNPSQSEKIRKESNGESISEKGSVNSFLSSSKSGNINALMQMVDSGIRIDATDENGSTALMIAAGKGHSNIVSFLISRGANVNERDAKWGGSAIAGAAFINNVEIVDMLIKAGANTNATDNKGITPIMLAAQKGNTNVVIALINGGANVNQKDEDGSTPLMIAAANGRVDTARILIDKGADVNAVYKDGRTVLMKAANKGNIDIVGMLLLKGATVHALSDQGKSALDYAKGRKNNSDVINILMKAK